MRAQDSKINRAVGEHFRRARESLGWTLEDVARRVEQSGGGVSLSALSRFERGMVTLSLIDSIALCRSLGTSFASLEEIVRSAAVRELVDVTDAEYDDLVKKARRHRELGNAERALAYFEAAFDWTQLHADDPQNADRRAWSLIEAADMHRHMRHFNTAQEMAVRVLNERTTSKENRLRAMVLSITISYMAGDFFRARLIAAEVRPALAEADRRVRAYALGAIGALATYEGRYADAIEPLREACQIYQEDGFYPYWTKLAGTLGYALAKSGDREAGIQLLCTVREKALAADYLQPAFNASIDLADVKLSCRQFDEARAEYEACVSLARRRDDPQDLFRAWHGLWRLEGEIGDATARKKIETILKRLLRRLTAQIPEAESFALELVQARTGKKGAQ